MSDWIYPLLAIIGYVGINISVFFEIYHIYRRKSVKDISLGFVAIYFMSLLCLQIYMYHVGDLILFIGNLLGLVESVILMILYVLYKSPLLTPECLSDVD